MTLILTAMDFDWWNYNITRNVQDSWKSNEFAVQFKSEQQLCVSFLPVLGLLLLILIILDWKKGEPQQSSLAWMHIAFIEVSFQLWIWTKAPKIKERNIDSALKKHIYSAESKLPRGKEKSSIVLIPQEFSKPRENMLLQCSWNV